MESLLKSNRFKSVRNTTALTTAIVLCVSIVASGQNLEKDQFMEIDVDNVAFPEVDELPVSTPQVSIRKGEWLLSASRESDRQILSARSSDKLVTQSISQNAVFKRFVFDLKRQRFEPMRQEIRIELSDERRAQRIEQLSGVSNVKYFERLGFAIVKVDAAVDPVSVLRVLRREFESTDARILTGFSDNEPM